MIRFGCCLPGSSFMPQADKNSAPPSLEYLTYIADTIIGVGYDYIEANALEISHLTEKEVEDLASLQKQGKFRVEACNSFISPELQIVDGSKREELRVYVEDIMQKCQKLGIRIIVFGSGGARLVSEHITKEDAQNEIKYFLTMCNEIGIKYRITIAIEPLNSKECNILTTVAESAIMTRELNLPNIRLLADSHHMFCENEDLSVMSQNSDILVHIHISEAPDRVYPGKNGGEYLKEFAKTLKKTGYDARISVECGGFTDFSTDITNALTFMKEIFCYDINLPTD